MEAEPQLSSRLRDVDATIGRALDALCKFQDEIESDVVNGDHVIYRRVVEAYHANLRLAVVVDVIKRSLQSAPMHKGDGH